MISETKNNHLKERRDRFLEYFSNFKNSNDNDDREKCGREILDFYKKNDAALLIDLLKEGKVPFNIFCKLALKHKSLKNYIGDKDIVILQKDNKCVAIDYTDEQDKQEECIKKIMNDKNKSFLLEAFVHGSGAYSYELGELVKKKNVTTIFLPNIPHGYGIFATEYGSKKRANKLTNIVKNIYDKFQNECGLHDNYKKIFKKKYFNVSGFSYGNLLSFPLAKNLCKQNVTIDQLTVDAVFRDWLAEHKNLVRHFDDIKEKDLKNIKNICVHADPANIGVLHSMENTENLYRLLKKKFTNVCPLKYRVPDSCYFFFDKDFELKDDQLFIKPNCCSSNINFIDKNKKNSYTATIIDRDGTIKKGKFHPDGWLMEGDILDKDGNIKSGKFNKEGVLLGGGRIFFSDGGHLEGINENCKNWYIMTPDGAECLFDIGEQELSGKKMFFGSFESGAFDVGSFQLHGDRCYRMQNNGVELYGKFEFGYLKHGTISYDQMTKIGNFDKNGVLLDGNECIIKYPNGNIFTGKVGEKEKITQGILTSRNGNVVSAGKFSNNLLDGDNCCARLENGTILLGKFTNNDLVDGYILENDGKYKRYLNGKAEDIKLILSNYKDYDGAFAMTEGEGKIIFRTGIKVIDGKNGKQLSYEEFEPGYCDEITEVKFITKVNGKKVGTGDNDVRIVMDRYGNRYFCEISQERHKKKLNVLAVWRTGEDSPTIVEDGKNVFEDDRFGKTIKLGLNECGDISFSISGTKMNEWKTQIVKERRFVEREMLKRRKEVEEIKTEMFEKKREIDGFRKKWFEENKDKRQDKSKNETKKKILKKFETQKNENINNNTSNQYMNLLYNDNVNYNSNCKVF